MDFTVDINNALDINMHIPLDQQQLANGKFVPKVGMNPFNVHFDQDRIKISLDGGLVAWIADLFMWAIKWIVIDSIEDQLHDKIP